MFEAIGLSHEVIDRYFTGTTSKLGGIGLDVIAEEVAARHRRPTPNPARRTPTANSWWVGSTNGAGKVNRTFFDPDTVFRLQHSTRAQRFDIFREYTNRVNDQSRRLADAARAVRVRQRARTHPARRGGVGGIDRQRFSTGAMSYGSISREAHETLAIAMNRLGAKSNTGEGGEDPDRFTPDANGDLRRSAIKQVASGRFGVTSEYLVNADDIQIKMAQGAKPGEGGQLPAHKVYPWVAKTRHSTPGVGLISPPPHHDIYSIEDLAQLIHDLKNANNAARIHVARVRGGRRHCRGRGGEGARRRDPDLRPRRRHRCLAADQPQARRRTLGTRPGGDPADVDAQPLARPRGAADRRSASRPVATS